MSQVLPLWRHHNPMPMVHDRIFASGMSEADIAALQVATWSTALLRCFAGLHVRPSRQGDVERIDALEQYFTAWTIKTHGAAGACVRTHARAMERWHACRNNARHRGCNAATAARCCNT